MMLVFVEVDSDTDGNFRFVAPKIFLEGEMPFGCLEDQQNPKENCRKLLLCNEYFVTPLKRF